jgi:cathepsin L
MFAATGVLEAANMKKNGRLVSISEQQFVDCEKRNGDYGCQGGLPWTGFFVIYLLIIQLKASTV